MINLIFPMKPKSLNAGRRQLKKYRERIIEYVSNHSFSRFDKSQKIACTIYYFHRKKTEIDADNMGKPLLDALKGVFFEDDSQVIWRLAVRINALEDYVIENKGMDLDKFDELFDFISTRDHVVYVELKKVGSLLLAVGQKF
ncbi:MAG: RusA family crossover junction endodeoxyribonuclease [Bacillota bacterium]